MTNEHTQPSTNRPRAAPDGMPHDSAAVTPRSLITGLALSAMLSFLAVRSNVVYGGYTGFTDHFSTIGAIFILFWISVIAVLSRVLKISRFLSPPEFVTVYAMLMVATVLPTMGLGGYLIPLTAGVWYFANPENQWDELILPNLPDWIAPRQSEAITYLFEGVPPEGSVPWGAWIGPLLLWGLFAFGLFLASVSILVVVRKQWVENERLAFPLAAIPIEMAESCGRGPSFFSQHLMWVGFAIAFIIPFTDAVRLVFDLEEILPSLQIPAKYIELKEHGLRIQFGIDLLMVGLGYLVSLEILLSVWFFYLLTSLEGLLLKMFWPRAHGGLPHAAGGVLLGAQQVGALFAMILASLWIGRNGLRQFFRNAVSGRSTGQEILSERWAVILALVGTGCLVVFMCAFGLNLHWAILFVILALGLMFGIARVLAQTGMARVRAPHAPGPLMASFGGTQFLGVKGTAALGLGFCWAGDIQLFLMGTCANALKVIGEVARNKKGIFIAMSLAMVVATAVTFITYIGVGSDIGLMNGYGWYFRGSPRYHWGWIARSISSPRPPIEDTIPFFLNGAAIAGILASLSARFSAWPIHPIGLAICQINTVWHDWFSLFLAWAVKGSLLRFGGAAAYQKARPLFFGLILGSCVGIGLKAVWCSFALGG